MTGMISTLTVNKDAIDKALTPEMLATDIAYFLVRKGWGFKIDIISRTNTSSRNIEFRISFRRAHGLAGQVVAKSEDLKTRLEALSASTFSEIDDAFGDGTEIQKLLQSYYDSVEQYSSSGGTSKRSVLQAIEKTKDLINKNWKLFFILKWYILTNFDAQKVNYHQFQNFLWYCPVFLEIYIRQMHKRQSQSSIPNNPKVLYQQLFQNWLQLLLSEKPTQISFSSEFLVIVP